jgi:N-acetyl-gamma-glutamyl-phosphate reductase
VQTVKAAIVGASGYSGEELVALLARHPQVEIVALTSRQSAGKSVAEIFPRMAGSAISAMKFVEPSAEALAKSGASVVFLALPHGLAAEFAAPLRKAGIQGRARVAGVLREMDDRVTELSTRLAVR